MTSSAASNMRRPAAFYLVILLNVTASWQLAQAPANLQAIKQWKLFDWDFLPHHPTSDLNFYNPNNVLSTGVAIGRNRIYVATPKLFSGVPSTLNYIEKSQFGDSPRLQPYPDWSYSTTTRTDFNCSDLVLISVYRVRIDSCNRLWALDAGVSRSLEDYEITCPPKLLVIDLHTDQVVRRIDFPKEILRGESLFTNLVVDETTSTSRTCDDVFVYITDTVEPGIIVYDSQRDVTWRLSHPSMYPDPDFAQSRIHQHEFVLMDGVVGMAFDAKRGIVYYQPLATDRIFSVSREVLRAGPLPQNQQLEVKLVGKKSSQGIGLGVWPGDGSLVFSPLSETAVASWNPLTNKQSVLSYDPVQLQFIADMTVTPHDPNAIYVISSKFHRFFLKNLNADEINNRILRIQLNADNEPTNLQSLELISSHLNAIQKPIVLGGRKPLSYFNYFINTNHRQSNSVGLNNNNNNNNNKSPYIYEPLNIINYSLNNPFAALNHGESLLKSSSDYKTKTHSSFLDN